MLYQGSAGGADLRAGFRGVDSTTSGAIPLEQMLQWRDATVRRIRELRPRRVLEIGVGTGLLLAELAAECEAYWGTDFSAPVLEALQQNVAAVGGLAERVVLRHQAADDFSGLPRKWFDTIVVNSVVQYFPGADYLAGVLGGAVGLLAPGGAVFVGDVRHLGSRRIFRTAAALRQAGADADAAAAGVRGAAEQALVTEKELLADPEFFTVLARAQAGVVSGVDIRLKRGEHHNELTRYRYDVILHTRPGLLDVSDVGRVRWGSDVSGLAGLADLLAARPGLLRVTGVPNSRVCGEAAAAAAVGDDLPLPLAAECLAAGGIDPEQLHRLAGQVGYQAVVTWSEDHDSGQMDAVFVAGVQPQPLTGVYQPRDEQSLAACTNTPISSLDVADLAAVLRAFAADRLPDHMVPAAVVVLDALPLTVSGKVDRKALPVPDYGAAAGPEGRRPATPMEETVCAAFAEVLGLEPERVGAEDSFFALGGHSLLAAGLVQRLRERGVAVPVRALFEAPTPAGLAVASGPSEMSVPPNLIPAGAQQITPQMVTLAKLTGKQIGRITAAVEGGAANVADIYPLAPLQEGLFCQQLMAVGTEAHLKAIVLGFASRSRLAEFLGALQQVVDRRDIYRTSLAWEGLAEPVQVVWRQAAVPVTEVTIAAGGPPAIEDLLAAAGSWMDLRRAPLLRAHVAAEPGAGRWLALLQVHHLALAHLDVVLDETTMVLRGERERLQTPLPFRNFVAHARLGVPREDHERYFADLLGDVKQPTAPFGLLDVNGDGTEIRTARAVVDAKVARRLRTRARALGVSPATVFHLVFARVLAAISGHADVVFGTVLLGRMQAGARGDWSLGPFVNKLPVRVNTGGAGVAGAMATMQAQLARLLAHEHAPLILAQRVSGVAAPAPIFTSILNYRHVQSDRLKQDRGQDARGGDGLAGIRPLFSRDPTKYPLMVVVDDTGTGFGFTVDAAAPGDPAQVCALLRTCAASMVSVLEDDPATPLGAVQVLDASSSACSHDD